MDFKKWNYNKELKFKIVLNYKESKEIIESYVNTKKWNLKDIKIMITKNNVIISSKKWNKVKIFLKRFYNYFLLFENL